MITTNAATGHTILLGREGENLARSMIFDIADWISAYGVGTVSLIAQRSGDTEPYPCTVTVDGSSVTWLITAADTARQGYGKCELRYAVGDVLVKSETWLTYTADALGTPAPKPPEPQKAWVDKVLEAGQAAVDASVNSPKVGDNGNWFVWDFEAGKYVDTGVAASGGGSGAVNDVQINGRSIMSNGVANIPVSKSNWEEASTYELRRLHVSYGLAVLDEGTAAIIAAKMYQIDERMATYNPITPKQLDYSVKVAMCDGKGAAWTDVERIAALLRMGCTVDDNGFVKWCAQEVAE